MVACSNCGRNFAEDRIEKHEDICLKTSKKKRKTFDMTKKRVQGTDAESFVLPKGKRGITSKGTSSNAVAATSVSASKQVKVVNQLGYCRSYYKLLRNLTIGFYTVIKYLTISYQHEDIDQYFLFSSFTNIRSTILSHYVNNVNVN